MAEELNWASGHELLESVTDSERRGRSLERDMLELVLAVSARLDDGEELTDGEPAAIKQVLTFLHARLERVERDVIRHLKFDSETARTWDEVAAEFGNEYGSRAAIFNRWKRLTDSNRRTTSMDMRRGAAVRRSGSSPLGTSETSGAPTAEEVDPSQTDLLTSVDQ